MKSQGKDTIDVMLEAAYENKIINESNLNVIPELNSTIEKATKFFHRIAINAMRDASDDHDPQAGVYAMQRICIYMFSKGIEAVMLHSDSPDGNISIELNSSEISDLNIQTDLDPERRAKVLTCFPLADALFQAHYEFMGHELTTPPGRTESWCFDEIEKAIRWSMHFGIMYAIGKGYHS